MARHASFADQVSHPDQHVGCNRCPTRSRAVLELLRPDNQRFVLAARVVELASVEIEEQRKHPLGKVRCPADPGEVECRLVERHARVDQVRIVLKERGNTWSASTVDPVEDAVLVHRLLNERGTRHCGVPISGFGKCSTGFGQSADGHRVPAGDDLVVFAWPDSLASRGVEQIANPVDLQRINIAVAMSSWN